MCFALQAVTSISEVGGGVSGAGWASSKRFRPPKSPRWQLSRAMALVDWSDIAGWIVE